MKPSFRFNPRRMLPFALTMALVTVATPGAAAHDAQATPAETHYLLYVPSRSASVDHAANVRAFEENGFSVMTLASAGERRTGDYARRVTAEVRGLIDRGVAPQSITVVGAGSGSTVAAITSAMTGNRGVNYVLLGQCDSRLTQISGFHMSGRVLGVRDADDPASLSCRPLWRGAAKVGQRRDLVVHSGYGHALFDQPRAQWLQPLMAWSQGGSVDVGELRIGAVDRDAGEVAAVASGR